MISDFNLFFPVLGGGLKSRGRTDGGTNLVSFESPFKITEECFIFFYSKSIIRGTSIFNHILSYFPYRF